MAFVTLKTLEGEPVEDFANKLFRQWGIGRKTASPPAPGQPAEGTATPERDQGLLLLLVTDERRSRLEVGYGLEGIIPDGYAGELLRQMRPALREGRYGDAMLTAAHTLAEQIARAKGIDFSRFQPPPRAAPTGSVEIPWPILLGGIFLLFWLVRAGRRGRGYSTGAHGGFLPGMVLGSVLNRSSYGGHSHGGFGSYDSGGGFGGFGGGDSGGGGASSDW
jgi:uncharacterized protein